MVFSVKKNKIPPSTKQIQLELMISTVNDEVKVSDFMVWFILKPIKLYSPLGLPESLNHTATNISWALLYWMPGRQRGADGLGSPSENTRVTGRWRQLCIPPGRAMGMNGTETEYCQPLEGKMSLCGAEVGSQEGGGLWNGLRRRVQHDSGGGG